MLMFTYDTRAAFPRKGSHDLPVRPSAYSANGA